MGDVWLFWSMLIVWGVCFIFWITSDVWQRCLGLRHNYEELVNLDEDDFSDNPILFYSSEDEGGFEKPRRGCKEP